MIDCGRRLAAPRVVWRRFDLVGSLRRGVLQGRIECKSNSHMYLMAILLLSGKALPYFPVNNQPVPVDYDTIELLTLARLIMLDDTSPQIRC